MNNLDDLTIKHRKRKTKKAWQYFKNEFWSHLRICFIAYFIVIIGGAIILNVFFYFISNELPFKGDFWLNNALAAAMCALSTTTILLTARAWEIYKNDKYPD